MPHPLVDKIRAVIEPPIEAAAYELVEIEFRREQGGWVLRVFIDHAEGVSPSVGPIGISDCERVSRELSAVLDVADVISQAYNLEVSSPGLDRPLRKPAHFRRFVGQKARIKLHNGVEGRRNFAGTIKAVPEGEPPRVAVEVDGKEWLLPLGDLDKANLIYELEGRRDK